MDYYIDVIIRLLVSVLLGGLIGIERSGTNHDAGLRTHILVCIGAAGIMVMSQKLVNNYDTDISRLGAQVVSGIGFLGAGCILVNGNRIRGLTTAAGLWTTACIGLATGMGYYFISVTITVLVLVAMLALRPIAARLQNRGPKQEVTFRITVKNRQAFEIVSICAKENECNIIDVVAEDENAFVVRLSKTTKEKIIDLICGLMEYKDILKIENLTKQKIEG